ncbi:hypothetical protein [Candidatus Ruminimicrobium bovinum]|uniref:hypothetical protein n=1 Tax=Candidatus Ruminimicrobium bovinum TaxID=3242779 RepID=UPI0039B99418
MTKNIIFTPFFFNEKYNSGMNVFSKDKKNIYLKNICVSLISARHYNKSCDIALVTNLQDNQIDKKYKHLLENNNIKIFTFEYDTFCFPKNYPWASAFYKLCALDHLVKMDYENYCYLDADTYIQNSFDNIWKETKDNILLYDINHGLDTKDYITFCKQIKFFFNKEIFITQYGGEFFAANLSLARKFIEKAKDIYNEMKNKCFLTSIGDEFILSITAYKLRDKIKNAGAYIFRFWTDSFRLVSTCYKFNKVSVLHLPSEKERGIIKIFNKFISQNKIPKDKQIWKICHLSNYPLIDKIKLFIKETIKNENIINKLCLWYRNYRKKS